LTSHSNRQRAPSLLRVRTCQRTLICISCFIVAKAYTQVGFRSILLDRFSRNKFHANRLDFRSWHANCWEQGSCQPELGMLRAQIFWRGGRGGSLPPTPLPEKAASFISRLLFTFRANCLLDLELLLSLELYF
jgi:hypothetical protein